MKSFTAITNAYHHVHLILLKMTCLKLGINVVVCLTRFVKLILVGHFVVAFKQNDHHLVRC